MKPLELKVNIRSLDIAIAQITRLVADGVELRVSIKKWRESRTLNQNAFQHVIYTEISKYLIGKGRGDWTKDKTKDNLKNTFLGWHDVEYINVKTGEKTIKSELKKTSDLDTGEAYHYTTQLLDWAESIGCQIKIPANCEYRELMERQTQ